MSLFPSKSTTTDTQSTAPSAPLPIPAFDMQPAMASDADDQPELELNCAVDVDTDSIPWSETLYAVSQDSNPAFQAWAEPRRARTEHERKFQAALRDLAYDDASLLVPDDTQGDAWDLGQDLLDSSFFHDSLESPLDAMQLSLDSLGTPVRPVDLDADDTLTLEFSQAQVHASPHNQASSTGTLSAEAQDGDQAHAGAATVFDLNLTLDLDSDTVPVDLLMGCTQQAHAAPHGGYHP